MQPRTSSTHNRSLFQRLNALERIPGFAPEWVAFFLYVALLAVVCAFHEPWFDEAQSWQIARVASLRDILLTIPHYEGHPPLWHLLLALPAKLGAPYELGLKTVNILISASAVWLLLFRSPFPRIVKLPLPFTYFLFYQYGVLSRPYSLMFLAFVLAAMAYPARNVRPFRYVLVLVLLCLCSAYGLALAGGIALVWLIELLRERPLLRGRSGWLRDRRLWALLLLLLVALATVLLILPAPDTYATGIPAKNGFPVRLLYTALVLPADACFYDCFAGQTMLLSAFPFNPATFAGGVVLGLLFWAALVYLSRSRRTTALLLIPYACFAVFSAFVYISRHHIGIAALFLLFWFWVDARLGKDAEQSSAALAKDDPPKSAQRSKKAEFTRALRVVILTLTLGVSLFWTVSASSNEIRYPYGFGRALATYLQSQHLESSRIMCGWGDSKDPVTGQVIVDTNYSGIVALLPYFDHNIVFTFNGGADKLGYTTHRRASEAENATNFKLWAAGGAPDLLLGRVDLQSVFGNNVTIEDYTVAAKMTQVFVWKADCFADQFTIYRKID